MSQPNTPIVDTPGRNALNLMWRWPTPVVMGWTALLSGTAFALVGGIRTSTRADTVSVSNAEAIFLLGALALMMAGCVLVWAQDGAPHSLKAIAQNLRFQLAAGMLLLDFGGYFLVATWAQISFSKEQGANIGNWVQLALLATLTIQGLAWLVNALRVASQTSLASPFADQPRMSRASQWYLVTWSCFSLALGTAILGKMGLAVFCCTAAGGYYWLARAYGSQPEGDARVFGTWFWCTVTAAGWGLVAMISDAGDQSVAIFNKAFALVVAVPMLVVTAFTVRRFVKLRDGFDQQVTK